MFENLSTLQLALMCSLLAAIVLSCIVGIIISLKKKELYKPFSIIAVAVNSALLAALIIGSMVETYKNGTVNDFWNEFGLYICTFVIIAVIIAILLIFGKKQEVNHTKAIVYGALCIGLAFALSYVRLFDLPSGGSVTLASLLPLFLYSYMFGIRKGALVGFVYSFLQFIQAPWFYHPIQFLLDYTIAFAAVGLSGIFHELRILEKIKPLQFALGAICAIIIRYFAHVISGIFVFGSGDPENYTAVAWSFLYNSFAFVDLAIALIPGCAMFASKSFTKLLEKATV